MESKLIRQARDMAVNAHRSTNHLYDGQPYERHLEMVVGYAIKYKNLIETDPLEVVAAAWMHDTIEDCRLTYNDVKQALGVNVAELGFALTNEKGRNRKERASDTYYAGIRAVPDAAYLKICDRLANIQYSRDTGSKMFKAYKQEHLAFKEQLWRPKYIPMFNEMEMLLWTNPVNQTN